MPSIFVPLPAVPPDTDPLLFHRIPSFLLMEKRRTQQRFEVFFVLFFALCVTQYID